MRRYFFAVSRAIVESEWVIPIPVSDIAGAMAEVSAAGVSARFWQPAMRSTALKTRIVFIVTPSRGSAVSEPSREPSLSPAGTRGRRYLCRRLCQDELRRTAADSGGLNAASTATRIEVYTA